MTFFRAKNLRFLYLLALAQLVGGPLMLLQVTMFCKLTLHETPQVGVAQAAVKAWHSEDFQAVLTAANPSRTDLAKSPLPEQEKKSTLEKCKQPLAVWGIAPLVLVNGSSFYKIVDPAWARPPDWPNAPPGPPPRIGS